MKTFQFIALAALLSLLSFSVGCEKQVEVATKTDVETKTIPEPVKTATPVIVEQKTVDVPQLAGKSPKDIDAILGKPKEAKNQGSNADYRLYNVANEPKGLAIRFLGGRAVSFNLLLSKSYETSQEALLKGFGINVGSVSPTKNVNEPLTEKFQGKFNDRKFNKVSAKRDESGKGFVFVLAEVAE